MKTFRLSPRQKKWMLSAHILFVIAWLGGTLCMLTLITVASKATNIHELTATTLNIDVLDEVFIKIPAMGSLITGILLSIFSNWGLTNYYWIIVKTILNIALIIFGILGMNHWNGEVIRYVTNIGWEATQLPGYTFASTMRMYGSVLSSSLMIFMVVISSIKPWGKLRHRS